MITPDEQLQLKELFGYEYAEAVSDILEERGVRNRNGHPHQLPYIRKVFQAKSTNIDVEAAIWELAKRRKKEAAKAEKLKREILT